MSMILKGGNTIWGGLDWSPEEGHACRSKKKNSNIEKAGHSASQDLVNSRGVKYGRLVSFGKDVADLNSSEIKRVDFRVTSLSFGELLTGSHLPKVIMRLSTQFQ